jgi:hypothetical protein
VSETGQVELLTNITPCTGISVNPAFGPAIRPTSKGLLSPYNLETLIVDDSSKGVSVTFSHTRRKHHGHQKLDRRTQLSLLYPTVEQQNYHLQRQ